MMSHLQPSQNNPPVVNGVHTVNQQFDSFHLNQGKSSSNLGGFNGPPQPATLPPGMPVYGQPPQPPNAPPQFRGPSTPAGPGPIPNGFIPPQHPNLPNRPHFQPHVAPQHPSPQMMPPMPPRPPQPPLQPQFNGSPLPPAPGAYPSRPMAPPAFSAPGPPVPQPSTPQVDQRSYMQSPMNTGPPLQPPMPPLPQPGGYYGVAAQGLNSPPQMQPIAGMPPPVPPMNAPQGLPHGMQFHPQAIEGRPVNLLQERNILPPNGVELPVVHLPPIFSHDVQCDPSIFRCTLNAVPRTSDLLKKCRLPLGLILHPFKDMKQLSVLQASVIVRCKSCRTYINPYVQFPDMRRWRCNMCHRVNDLPEEFHFDPVSKSYGEPQRRPEIKNTTVEFIAPQEYMLRPPQPAVYVYVLDVSFQAIQTGYLKSFCKGLADNLERVPGDSRAMAAFIAIDSCVHFFKFVQQGKPFQQYVLPDLDDVFVPHNQNVLMNIDANKEDILNFLDTLPAVFANNTDTNNALGAGLMAAFKLTESTGGRVTIFQVGLPNIGPGFLEAREDPNLRASKEIRNLQPANDYYKTLSLDCNGKQIAMDLFILSTQYSDIATLSTLPRFCGGVLHFYPGFHDLKNPLEVARFEEDFDRYLTRKVGFEAVLRIRCTRGLSLHTFHGNAFVRSFDLLALPNINPDTAYGVQLQIEETLPADNATACFQAALLYTTSKAERRIRVHTLCLPLTNSLADIHAKADSQAVVALLARMAVDRSIQANIQDAREAMVNAAVDPLVAFGSTITESQRMNAVVAPNALKLLPLYVLGLLKHHAFSYGTSIRLDQRVFAMCEFKTMSMQYAMSQIYPALYPLHQLDDNNPEPPRLHLSFEKVDRHGLYLMDIGHYMYLYIGQAISDILCVNVFNVSSFSKINEDMVELPEIDTPQSRIIREFLVSVKNRRPFAAPLVVIKDGSPISTLFTMRMVDDRTESAFSYIEFVQFVQKELSRLVK